MESPAIDLYLELLKGCLTRELFPDEGIPVPWRRSDRAREGLRRLVRGGAPQRVAKRIEFSAERRAEGRDWPSEAETMIGRERLDNLDQCVRTAVRDGVPGDLIETGVWRGGATILMKGVLAAHGDATRQVWVADSFEGLPRPDGTHEADDGDWTWTAADLAVGVDEVKANFERYGLLDERVRFLKGWFRDTLPDAPIESLAVLRLDGDLYESTIDALSSLYPKVSPGGFVIVDDYGAYPACRQAISDYRTEHDITDEIQEVDWSGVYWRRS